MWLETIPKCGNNGHKCPTCGGDVRRRVYGEMYAGAFIHDGQRVEIRKHPDAGHIDPVVLDPITQYFGGALHRCYPQSPYFSRGGKLLHRACWESAFGPLPSGVHVHHKDANPANNAISNLECLPIREHMSAAVNHKNAKIKARLADGTIAADPFFTAEAREKAAEWHRSEAGRLWHKRHAESSKGWEKWKRIDKPCEFCGVVFNALERKSGHSQKYCTLTCKSAAYRQRQDAS